MRGSVIILAPAGVGLGSNHGNSGVLGSAITNFPRSDPVRKATELAGEIRSLNSCSRRRCKDISR